MMEIKTYRKKPVAIEAVQTDPEGSPAEWHSVYKWVEDNTDGSFDVTQYMYPHDKEPPKSGVSIDPGTGLMVIASLEGIMQVTPGDYIIRGIEGEFYPCKPSIFEASYEEVNNIEKGEEK